MKIPNFARYDYVNKKASEFLSQYQIISFPIEPESIIAKERWGIQKYSELMEYFKCDVNRVCKCLESLDGYTIYDDENYSIAYNDVGKSNGRIRFTLMHEIGHIYLNHLIDFEKTRIFRGGLSKDEDKVLENEANAFARNVLAPTSMIQHLKNKSIYNVSSRFGLTYQAARVRMDLFLTDYSVNEKTGVLKRLNNVFYCYCYKKKYTVCGVGLIQKSDAYCSICGNKTLKWGDGEIKYPKMETYENRKVKECPRCENEETDYTGDYCQICSLRLVNECSNRDCEAPLETNARYCPICGSESSFYVEDVLKAWNYRDPSDGFMSIPDATEDDYPFN